MRMVNLNNRSSAFLTRLTQSFGLVILAAFMSTQLNAQCALACNGSIQVSLDTNCEAEITPALALSDDSDIGSCDYTVTIKDYNDGILMSTDISGGSGNYIFPIVDNTYLGDSLKVEIDDGDPDTAPCWGWMIIEDKLAPTLTCLADLTIDCDADDSMLVGQDETFTLSLDTEVSDDGTCVVFDIAALASMPSPLGIIQTAIMSYSATNATVSAAVITTSAGTHVGVVDPVAGTITYSSLVGVQTTATNLSFPWTIKFTYAAVDGALAHSVDAATLTINSSSYFDVNSGSAVLDNCDDIDITIISDDFIPNACRDIDPNCASYRTIVYTATDASGNSAQECTFNICYEKKTLADITVPASSTMACENFNINNLPGLLLDGAAFEYVGNLCQFNVQFTDNMLPGCSGSMLIDRTWTIVDWCTGDLLQRDQVINVVDDIAPTIVCPLDSMEFVSNDGCLLDLTLEPQGTGPTAALQLDDNCTDNDDLIIEVYYLRGDEFDQSGTPLSDFNQASPDGNGGFLATDLQLGLNWIRYYVTDECGNENSCFFEIVVVNDDPPHAVCDQFTTVSLQDNGWARMLPISLDDGSYDPCGEEISFKAKRMDIQPCSGEPDFEPLSAEEIACDNYREFVQFCCADAGLYIPVSLLVTDASGNTAECTVQVLVQDKTPFNGTPPTPTANISCDQYDEDTIYGNEPTAGNGCGAYTLDHEDTPNLDDCGNGTVTRRWFYVIGGVNVYLPETQIITISAVNFTVTMPAGPVTADCSTYTTDLGDEPRINGQPISNYDGCASLAWTYEDQEFKGIEGFCLKVIRTWTVLDHCVYDANSGSLAGYYQDTQVIYVNNDTAPTVSNCPEDMWYDPAPGTCSASVTLTGPDAVDACFGEQIDDSGYSYVVTDFFTGQVITSGTGRTDVLPLNLAAYVVTWTVEDDCGNTNSDCSHIVDVIDEKAPTPYCYGGITTVVMDGEFTQNGEPSIEIWASDFNIGSFDNCTDSIDLVYSFSSDITDTNMTYNCDSIGLKNVTIYVFDESGNYDFCETTVFIQANGETCDNGLLPRIAGKVETEDNRDVEDVDISLEAMTTNTMNYNFTNAQGLYAFDNTVWAEDYHIEAAKNDNYLNGVSTLDIVLIQRHILGIQALNSPYKMIAADANNSSSVSSIDLIELRKLILGIYSELPANDSWRFVDATETFSDINNPWPFTEDIDINQINADMMSNNFVGVKVGDVNGSVSLNIHDNEVDNRSNTTLRLIKDNTSFEAGEKVAVEITAHNFDQIFGMQYTIEFNQALLSFDNITSGALNIDANNLGLFNATEGQIGLSWNGAGSTATSVAQDQVLFTLWFNAKQTGNTSSLNISSSITNIEAYDNALQTMNVSLENRNLEQDYLTLYQNTPNPFNNSTEIGFSLPKAGNVVFEVYDVTGKVIKKSIEFHQKGYNSILFSTNDIKVDGVLYYKISTELETATKKMLLIH